MLCLVHLLALIAPLQSNWWPWFSPPKEDELQTYDYSELETQLSSTIFGQQGAIRSTADTLIAYQAGIRDPHKPIGCLLYIGPTGVGKTELAKEIARLVFGTEERLIRINLSEYNTEDGVHRLIGVAKGYSESELGGILSNALLAHPRSVLLLDEIEKAHPTVRALFLHVFDEGVFESGRGQRVNCRECLIIATTNLGAETILAANSYISQDDLLYLLEGELSRTLTPELFNRLTPIVFRSLSRDTLVQIIEFQLDRLAARLDTSRGIKLTFDQSVRDYLKKHGYHPKLGARPLQRLIKQEIEAPLARSLLRERFASGDQIDVRMDKQGRLLVGLRKMMPVPP